MILIHYESPLGLPVLPLVSFACMPSPLPRQVRWTSFARTISILVGLPQLHGGSAPALIVSRPAQRSLTLWPARSRSRLATLFTESSDRFVTSAVVSVATGWSEPVPGRELHPLKSSAFSRRTCNHDLSPTMDSLGWVMGRCRFCSHRTFRRSSICECNKTQLPR